MRYREIFEQEGLLVKENLLFRKLTTLRVGGPADLVFFPQNFWELTKGLGLLDQPPFFLGGGSNLLVRDGGLRGVSISLKHLKGLKIEEETVETEAGVYLPELLSFCVKQGLSGLEFLAGVPATVGGAVVMNAGAFGKEIADVLEEVTVWEKGSFRTYQRKELSFGYRDWGGPRGALVVKARFRLKKTSSEYVREQIKRFLEIRRQKQPVENASAGCVFKNPPEGPAAGYLIEKVGLKGFVLGGAAISSKHANFIINLGQAHAEDVLRLIDLAKEKVLKSFGIELKEEVVIVGEA